jgi:hypothetical protein
MNQVISHQLFTMEDWIWSLGSSCGIVNDEVAWTILIKILQFFFVSMISLMPKNLCSSVHHQCCRLSIIDSIAKKHTKTAIWLDD